MKTLLKAKFFWTLLVICFFANSAPAELVFQPKFSSEEVSAMESEENKRVMALTKTILSHYKVGMKEGLEIASTILEKSEQKGLDPLLVAAVIAQESSFKSEAISNQDYGLMQVNSYYHREKFDKVGGKENALEIANNIEMGTDVLLEYCKAVKGCESTQGELKMLRRYNGIKANNYPQEVTRKKHKLTETFQEVYASL